MVNREPSSPSWVSPAGAPAAGWPCAVRTGGRLPYRLPLHRDWSGPTISSAGPAVSHAYRGRSLAEWATVGYIATADPSADVTTWVNATLAMTGFPALAPWDIAVPTLLEWTPRGASPTLADRIGVAEAFCFDGLAAIDDSGGHRLLRLYQVLARNAPSAWNIALAIESACAPGTDEQLVAANDHIRANATFGGLRLG